jgi:hypothetical protein
MTVVQGIPWLLTRLETQGVRLVWLVSVTNGTLRLSGLTAM